MARVLITGSADGLGLMAGQLLADGGHAVTLHTRSSARADHARRALPSADVLVGDVATIDGMREVAEQANASGRFDAVIHNVGIGYRESRRIETVDGLAHVFAINVLAPYVLTALITPPDRLVYLSSGLHRRGDPSRQRRAGPSGRRRNRASSTRWQRQSGKRSRHPFLLVSAIRRWVRLAPLRVRRTEPVLPSVISNRRSRRDSSKRFPPDRDARSGMPACWNKHPSAELRRKGRTG